MEKKMRVATGVLVVAIFGFGVHEASASASPAEVIQGVSLITGSSADTGITFRSAAVSLTKASVDINFGLKTVHADVDYARQQLIIHSFVRSTGVSSGLSLVEVARFQTLLHEVPATITTSGPHVDALGSLINFVAEAPLNIPLDIDTTTLGADAITYTSICGEIGSQTTASYLVSHKLQTQTVTVGPVCYAAPALGRCGMAGGPDPIIGLVQRFTQQCLNHDACCAATQERIITIGGKQVNVCGFKGNDCVPQFRKAAPGFFFAESCGTTAGNWTDGYGYQYVLSKGSDNGEANDFKGQVTTTIPDCPTWNVKGVRTGTTITLTAKNPRGASEFCAGSYTYVGSYSDCSAASGTWSNDSGSSGPWSWSRTNTVGQVVMSSISISGSGPASRH